MMQKQSTTSSPPPDATTLALERTRVAYNRTILAQVRTATSLITFGFSVYKFFQLDLKNKSMPGQIIGPREFGITMIVIGLLSLLLATAEYYRDMRPIRAQYSRMPRSTAGAVAASVAVLGLLALIAAVLRE